jgi:BMFP domain-containing protein YqiC
MNAKLLEELNTRFTAFLQQTPVADVQKNMKAMLSSTFSQLDLVTREEFDIQTEVLKRTREKLGTLETRLAALEAGRQG